MYMQQYCVHLPKIIQLLICLPSFHFLVYGMFISLVLKATLSTMLHLMWFSFNL